MVETMLKMEHVSKRYRLGQIGGTTLRDELQRLGAKLRKKEDPTAIVGAQERSAGEAFFALENVSLEVTRGERVGIIGRNGAGKSTLLKLISRITAPTSGDIWLSGRVASMLEVGTGFHGELTGRENIYMNGAILGMKKREIDKKIEDIIEFSECRQFIDTPVKRYSSGMYVKLAFAVAAHLDAEIMIMDEVLAVGDMAFQKKCLEKMNDVSKIEGRTILYVSHNMNTIRQLCDRCVVLDHGKVVFDGDVEQAIGVYLGVSKNTDRKINLSNIEREPAFANHKVTMKDIETLDSTTNMFPVGSKLRFRLRCSSEEDIKNAFLRVVIKSADGTIVTMMTTTEGIALKQEDDTIVEFLVNASFLVPGKYSMSPILYEVNNFGANATLDVVRDVVVFEISQTMGFNNNMIWEPRYWGYVYGETIQLENREYVKPISED